MDLLGENFSELKFKALAKQKGKIIQLNLGHHPGIEVAQTLFKKIQRAVLHPEVLFQFMVRKNICELQN